MRPELRRELPKVERPAAMTSRVTVAIKGMRLRRSSAWFAAFHCPSCTLTMLLSLAPVIVGLLPLAAEAKVHKLKLHKLAPATSNPELESAWLAEKYGAPAQVQMPLMGAGGSGRRVGRPTAKNGETLFWTQEEEIQGGHGVPLSSEFIRV